MPLDFSKFVMPSPDVSWVSKLPEYSALGDKTAAEGKDKKSILPILNLLSSKSFEIKSAITNDQRNEIEDGLATARKEIQDLALAGASNDIMALKATEKRNEIMSRVQKVNQISTLYEDAEKKAKTIPGINIANFQKNFYNHYLLNPDGTSKKIADVVGNNDVITHFDDFLNESEDNYDTEGFKTALKDSNPNSTTQKFNKRDKAGYITEYYSSAKVPSGLYTFIETDDGDKPVVDGERHTFDTDYAKLMHEQLQDNETGDDVNIIPQNKLDAFENNYPGIKGYIEQEKRKFAKAAEAKFGSSIKDANGQYTLDFQQKMDDYGRAVAYKKFDELGTAMGGFSTSGGQPGKKDVVSDKAALPKRPGLTIINKISTEEPFTLSKNIQKTLDAKFETRDTDGFFDIKPVVSGLKDEISLNYGFQDVKLGQKDGKWTVKITNSNGDIKYVPWAEFYTIAGTQDSKDKRVNALMNIEKWMEKHPKL